jgi:WD40 repeat protein
VNAVFSPDGNALLTSANGFIAKAFEFTDPFLHRFHKQTQAINTVDYFQEEDRYLTAAFDSTARIYDGSGRLIDSLRHNGVVISAFFSRDGNRILTACHDSTARIWLPVQSRVIVLHHKADVTSAVFSHDGNVVVTSSLDSLVRIWSKDGEPLDSFHLKGEVYWAGFSHDDLRLLTISSDSMTTLWEIAGEKVCELKHHARIFSAAISPDGQKILTSCADSIVRQWSTTGEQLLSLRHFEKPRIAVYSEDGNYLITGGRMVKIWKANGKLEDSLSHVENISSIIVSPDSKLILTTCFDYNSYLWNFEGKLLATFSGHTAKINSGIFTHDGYHILTAADDGYILRWNTPEAIFDKLKRSTIAPLSAKEEERYGYHLWNSKEFIEKIKMAAINLLSSREGQ